ncbi:MAG: hypothetical protein FWG07_06155 [Treponema sp.]|nr:hypothetical protein [Treponema sp.]
MKNTRISGLRKSHEGTYGGSDLISGGDYSFRNQFRSVQSRGRIGAILLSLFPVWNGFGKDCRS